MTFCYLLHDSYLVLTLERRCSNVYEHIFRKRQEKNYIYIAWKDCSFLFLAFLVLADFILWTMLMAYKRVRLFYFKEKVTLPQHM